MNLILPYSKIQKTNPMLPNESIYHNLDKTSFTFENLERNTFLESFQLITLFVDLLLLNLILGICINFYSLDITFKTNTGSWLISFLVLANSIWLAVALYNDIYKWYELIRPAKKVKTLTNIISIYFAILTTVYYYIFFPVLNTNFLIPVFISFLFASIIAHLFFRKFYKKLMPPFQYIIVGGKPSHLPYISDVLDDSYGEKSDCVGWFGNSSFDNVKWLGTYSKLKQYVKHNSFDKLFYISSDLPKSEVRGIMDLCESRLIDFELIPRELDMFKGATTVVLNDKLTILAPIKEPLQRLRNKLIKRTFDIFFSLFVILTILPWLFPIIAFFIRLESNGPIFFLQKRTGYWNKPFQFIKFRSMAINKESNSKQAVRNDMRVTKVGAFLRKTSLDELPQFFNVLKGEMSVVGPRPHMLKHTEEYSELIETYMVRHKVKPGITGWAQINGYRGPTETLDKMQNRVKYDVHYMKNWTLLMDIRCVIFTVINMIRGEDNAC